MRSSKSRSRNKSNRQRSLGNIVNRVFDSSGPEGKVRGTPQQIIDKYLALARDAQLSNDRVAEQSFLQHAEHYTRMLGEAQREMAERQQQHNQNQRQNDDDNAQPRDGNGRDNGNRDQGGRDGGYRDQGGRGQNGRDQGVHDQNRRQDDIAAEPRREENPAAADASSPDQPQAAPEPRTRSRRAQSASRPVADEGLPDPVNPDEGDSAGPVATPETKVMDSKPKTPRTRAPRSTAPRTRRKPAADEVAEPAGKEPRADTAEGGTGQG